MVILIFTVPGSD